MSLLPWSTLLLLLLLLTAPRAARGFTPGHHLTTAPAPEPRQETAQDQEPEPDRAAALSRSCLRCICEARECDWSRGCQNDVCGGFEITRHYFATSNVTALPLYRHATHEVCTTDAQCAAVAVRLFLQRLGADCDGDGDVGCDDLMKTHYYGPTGCVGADWIEFSDTWKRFRRCQRQRGVP